MTSSQAERKKGSWFDAGVYGLISVGCWIATAWASHADPGAVGILFPIAALVFFGLALHQAWTT